MLNLPSDILLKLEIEIFCRFKKKILIYIEIENITILLCNYIAYNFGKSH